MNNTHVLFVTFQKTLHAATIHVRIMVHAQVYQVRNTLVRVQKDTQERTVKKVIKSQISLLIRIQEKRSINLKNRFLRIVYTFKCNILMSSPIFWAKK